MYKAMLLNRIIVIFITPQMQRYASIKDIENKGVTSHILTHMPVQHFFYQLLFTLYCIFDAPQHASFNCKLPTRDILAFNPPRF